MLIVSGLLTALTYNLVFFVIRDQIIVMLMGNLTASLYHMCYLLN